MSKILITFIVSLLLLTNSCGFKKLKQNSEALINVKKFETIGVRKISYYLKNEILLNSSNNSKNEINIILKTSKKSKSKIKNITGKTTKYSLSVETELEIENLKTKNKIKKIFSKTMDYNVAKNHTITIDRERKTELNVSMSIADDINRFLNIYFKK